jgi:Xaa-Pro dipeptidase
MRILPQIRALRSKLREHGAAGFLTLDPDQQTWLTGFRALAYTRPIVLLVGPERTMLIVPELEDRHAREHARGVDCVKCYNERPGAETAGSHTELLDALLDVLPAGAPVAIDEQRLPLSVAEQIRGRGCEPLPFAAAVRELIAVKHPHEIAAVRCAGEVVAIGVRATLDACRPGATELEVEGAGASAILTAASELGPDTRVEQLAQTPSGTFRCTLPHVFASTRRLEPGDVVIHSRQLALDGYRAELERTVIIGEPTDEQARAFQTMLDSQQAAIDALAPGVPASDVDRAARSVIERAGYGEHAIHRTGHGIGVGAHEHPYLRYDNPEPMQPGMLVTIEPGFYVPGLGGFRHSDTLLVTDDGAELLTHYPRSLDELTLGD